MNLVDRVTERVRTRGIVVPQSAAWNDGAPYSQSDWQSPEYGDYIATSNDVYSVINLRAKMLAKTPIVTYGKDHVEKPDSDLARLLRRPNPFWTEHRLKKFTEQSLGVWGEAYWVLDRFGGTRIREIWPVKATLMRPIPSKVDFLSGFVYALPDGTEMRLKPDQVVWLCYPNPNDLLAPLSPLAAARLAADVASQSMLANRRLFTDGMMGGGFISPADDLSMFSETQAKDLEAMIDRRFKGVSKAHRWQVLRYALKMTPANVTPKDAQYVEQMNVTFRQVCRAYGVPPPLVGDAEFATLANLQVYERQLWEHTMTDEMSFIESEINRQITPAFPDVEEVRFDVSEVVALQEDEQMRWARESEQLDRGAITINEWRESEGMEPVEWGDRPLSLADSTDDESDDQRSAGSVVTRAVTFRTARYDSDEDALAVIWRDLQQRIADNVLQRLKQRSESRSIKDVLEAPFEIVKWVQRTKAAVAARFVATHEKAILLEGRRVGLSKEQIADLIADRATRAAIEAQTQQFATRTTRTTWDALKAALVKGHRKGESLDQLARRVSQVMDVRASQGRMIARSEVTRAVTTGQIAAYSAAKIVGKRWRTQHDELVRETHAAVDGVTVGVGALFTVGAGQGQGPGQIGIAEEDINCRCVLEPVKDESSISTVEVDRDLSAIRAISAAFANLSAQ